MIPDRISFVDIETTGTGMYYDRIIEIGIIRVEDNQVVDEFQSLINPEGHLDPYIEKITGIRSYDLEKAPVFSNIKDRIEELLRGSVFAAHNVRFDYGFLRNEFKRLGGNLTLKHFCTVKLSRALYPGLPHYNLDSLIEKFGIVCEKRHRAYDDAKAIWTLYHDHILKTDTKTLNSVFRDLLKTPSLPTRLSHVQLKSLPEASGVYIFYGENKTPLYIGKSINIKDRVLSHFGNDLRSEKEMNISRQVADIEAIPTAGELGALLLESELIKKYQPLYNRKLRQSHGMFCLVKSENKDGFNTVEIKQLDKVAITDIQKILGVFKSQKQVKNFLLTLAKEHHLCQKLLGLERTSKACFGYQLGYCYGACVRKEKTLKYNLRFDDALFRHKVKSWPFKGPIIIKELADWEEGFLIDHWCLLGKVKMGKEEQNYSEMSYSFDYDTYKILFNKIYKDKKLKIHTLTRWQENEGSLSFTE